MNIKNSGCGFCHIQKIIINNNKLNVHYIDTYNNTLFIREYDFN